MPDENVGSLEAESSATQNEEISSENLDQQFEDQMLDSLGGNDSESTDQADDVEEGLEEGSAETKKDRATDEDSIDWTKDGRYKDHWAEDPNGLYKSYKSLEAKLQQDGDARNQLNAELEQMRTVNKQYEDVANYLDLVNQSPQHAQKLQEFFQEFNKDFRRKQYGADLPDHVIAKLDEVDAVKRELASIKQKSVVNEQVSLIDESLVAVDKLAKENGIEYSTEEFLRHCADNDIPPSLMKSVFIDLNLKNILSKHQSKTQETVLKNVNNNNSASMPVGTRSSAPSKSSMKSFGDFTAMLSNSLGIKN